MRRAYNNVKAIMDGETFLGFSLGYEFCAEHEWGIEKLRNKFGIDNTKMGVDGRAITKGSILFRKDKDLCVLTSADPWRYSDKRPKEFAAKDILAHDIHFYKEPKLETAWDEGDFCIASTNPDDFSFIEELANNFEKKNIVITFISSALPVFENSSLCVLIKDKLPKDALDEMYFVDKKAVDLKDYEKKIGVTALKEKARKNYSYKGDKYFMACSPRWINYEDPEKREEMKKKLGTKYDIQFWINYSDDDENYGWYNAEDIIKWLSTPGLKLKSLNKEK